MVLLENKTVSECLEKSFIRQYKESAFGFKDKPKKTEDKEELFQHENDSTIDESNENQLGSVISISNRSAS